MSENSVAARGAAAVRAIPAARRPLFCAACAERFYEGYSHWFPLEGKGAAAIPIPALLRDAIDICWLGSSAPDELSRVAEQVRQATEMEAQVRFNSDLSLYNVAGFKRDQTRIGVRATARPSLSRVEQLEVEVERKPRAAKHVLQIQVDSTVESFQNDPDAGGWPIPAFAFGVRGDDVLTIRVTPDHGQPWVASFALEARAVLNGVYACPGQEQLMVLAGRDGFLIRANNPSGSPRSRNT